jgi:hypothetical protein
VKIENLDCSYLKLYSSAYESSYNANQLSSIQIKVRVNHEDEITETINIVQLVDEWNLSLTFSLGTIIKQVYLRNIFTNQTFPLLPENSSYIINTTNVLIVENLITGTLNNVLNLSDSIADVSIENTKLLITISDLPYYIVADTLSYEYSSVVMDAYFTFDDNDGYLISNNAIYLLPSFFGKSTFTDGIYHFVTTVLTKQGVLLEEETCFFTDCATSQNLLDSINPDICSEKDVEILMLHYGLIVTSNQECDCSQMQNVFDYLEKNTDTVNTNPCGC